jgi:hypothetical protein
MRERVLAYRLEPTNKKPNGAFKRDELPFRESFGELRETSPGKDAMPLGAGFVIAFVVLPAFLCRDIQADVQSRIQIAIPNRNTELTTNAAGFKLS